MAASPPVPSACPLLSLCAGAEPARSSPRSASGSPAASSWAGWSPNSNFAGWSPNSNFAGSPHSNHPMCDRSGSSSESPVSRAAPRPCCRCRGLGTVGRIEEVARELQGARDAARRLKVRLRVPAILGGVLLVSAGYVGAVRGHWKGSAGSFCCHVTVTCGTMLLLLAVLPSDQRAPRVVTMLKVTMWSMVLMWYLMHLFVEVEEKAEPTNGCASRFFRAFCKVYWGGSYACHLEVVKVAMLVCLLALNGLAVYLVMGIHNPPHVVLDRLWKATRWTFVCLAATHAVVMPDIVYNGLREGMPLREVPLCSLRVLFDLAIAGLASWTKFRRRAQFCLQGSEVTAAAVIAAFISDKCACEVIQEARRSCRYVSLHKVAEADMRCCTPDPNLRMFSEPCELSDVDAFVSHSWHDPPAAKWQALQEWRDTFKAAHGREPRVWIDKYCLDQNNIKTSLMCLPVFLAGCQTLLVLAGNTYLTRLWCIEELFIYVQMGRPPASIQMRVLSPDVVGRIDSWSVRDAHCHLRDDEVTLKGTIEAGFHDLDAFTLHMRSVLRAALGVANP